VQYFFLIKKILLLHQSANQSQKDFAKSGYKNKLFKKTNLPILLHVGEPLEPGDFSFFFFFFFGGIQKNGENLPQK
jgi:hypothetical protein